MRKADSLPTFIIFCEDEVSEAIYFKYFETALIKVNPVKNQKSKTENVFKAITHCIKKDLMVYDEGVPKLIVEDVQIWCVYDRDLSTEEKQDEENTSFNAALETAKSSGINVAWSNDAFELWVLLHFEDLDPQLKENKNRKTYYEKLTNIFKSISNPSLDLTKALAYADFSYKGSLKSANNFRYIVRPEIISKTVEAIKRAETLEFFFNAGIPPHEKSPCTMVHYLVKELIRLGGKELK